MKRRLIYVLGAGVLAIGITVWALYPKPPAPGRQDYKFLHCDRCGLELPYNKDLDGKQCTKCAPKLSSLVPSKESVKSGGGTHNPFTKMFMVIYMEMLAVMAGVLYVTRKGAEDEDVEYLFMRCRNCQQKLRYREQQVGQFGKCPRCRRPLIFPAESLSVDE